MDRDGSMDHARRVVGQRQRSNSFIRKAGPNGRFEIGEDCHPLIIPSRTMTTAASLRGIALSIICVVSLLSCGNRVHGGRPATPILPRMHLHESKISEHNNTEYVREIMRLAKSAEMRNYMLPTEDPCDNFYRFACGNWPTINPADSAIPSGTNIFWLLSSAYKQKQLRVLKEEILSDDSEAIRKLKDFFRSCQQLRFMPDRTYKVKLREILVEFGHMPVLYPKGTWQANEFDWLNTTALIQQRYGIGILLRIGLKPDLSNGTINKVFIGAPDLALPTKSMYLSEVNRNYREEYKQAIAENLQKHLEVDKARAWTTAEEILSLEVRLARAMIDQTSNRPLKSLTKLRTVADLQSTYLKNSTTDNTTRIVVDFQRYLNITLGYELNNTLYEHVPDYLHNLVQVVDQTPAEQLANYILYQLVRMFFSNVKDDLSVSKRENQCLDISRRYFAKVLDYSVYRKFDVVGVQRDVDVIWKALKTTFQEDLESGTKFDWMTLQTRFKALDKLDAIRVEVNSYENSNLCEEFTELSIIRDDFITNLREVRKFERKHYVALPETTTAGNSEHTPQYIATENLVRIPVSLLQPHFLWSEHYPTVFQFGTLGVLVAHELLHGFDELGRNFDRDGRQQGWWDDRSIEAFNERKQCFKFQYAHFRYGGRYLPETNFQTENIADNGAVRMAYNAYNNWLRTVSAGNETLSTAEGVTNTTPTSTITTTTTTATTTTMAPVMVTEMPHGNRRRKDSGQLVDTLPNMNHSNRQLFFLAFAQFWCNDVNEDDLLRRKTALFDRHVPPMFRVIGSLANFDEFANEFHCAKGTTMHPDKRCQVY